LAKKLKQQNFNLYAQFNIEMIGVPMKEIIWLPAVLKNPIWEQKLMNILVKIVVLPQSCEYKLFYSQNIIHHGVVSGVPCQSVQHSDV
jgi:hypothetical protein